MAKKVKKSSSKLTKEQLSAQNAALSDQLAGLQSQVEELDTEADNLATEADELELRNDALQSALVSQKEIIEELEAEVESKESALQLADIIIAFAGKYEQAASEKIKELEQDNFHLSIQRDALRDRVKQLETPVIYIRKRSFGSVGVDND